MQHCNSASLSSNLKSLTDFGRWGFFTSGGLDLKLFFVLLVLALFIYGLMIYHALQPPFDE